MSEESTPPLAGGGTGKSQPLAEGTAQTTPANDTGAGKAGKLWRMLGLFAGGMSLNTFQAKELGDTCLHTTIASLQARHGLYFNRSSERVPNRFGTTSHVMRYWLQGDELERARAIVDGRTPGQGEEFGRAGQAQGA